MAIQTPSCSDSEWQLLFKILQSLPDLSASGDGEFWALLGNTVLPTYKLGSTNNEDVRMFTNNAQIATWFRSGELGVNISALPLGTLHSKGRSGQSPLYVINNAGGESLEFRDGGQIFRNATLFSIANTIARQNTTWGNQAGNVLQASSGTQNTLVGHNAGALITAGVSNTMIGNSAGDNYALGVQSTMVGAGAGSNTTGDKNTYLGYTTGTSQTTGIFNVMIGGNAGRHQLSVKPNAALNGNILLGVGSGDDTEAGSDWNILIGLMSGWGLRAGLRNIIIGNAVLATAFGAGNITAQLVNDNTTDSIGIGNLVAVDANNQLAIGSSTYFITHNKTFYSAGGVHSEYYRTTTPESVQAAQRGSVAYVDDGTTGSVYLKEAGTGTTGWINVTTNSGSFSQAVVGVATFTVTIGITKSNATYNVSVTPTAAVSAVPFYVNNKTTTTFDVVFTAALTGTVTLDWAIFQ